MAGLQLGIDFGTSNTVAVLRRADGVVTPLLFDSSPLLASGVFADRDGALLTGADAERGAAAQPGGFEANPKRRIDDGTVWLAERELPVRDVVAAVLARVAAEARRATGGAPAAVVLTHPAAWSRTRLALLADAAGMAGLGAVGFVPEPVAAAAYFTGVLNHRLPIDDHVVVYDLGAGTFDVSVVRRTPAGFDVVAADGLPDVGGLDLDAAVVAHARALTAASTDAWGRLDWPRTPPDQRDRRTLWLGARAAKEQLSRHSHADLHVPLVEAVLHVTREEFDAAARRYLDPTVELTIATLRAAAVPAERIAGVFLVGGSSRIPLAASLLHRALRIAPTAIDQPELVVAWGSLSAAPAPAPALPPHAPAPAVPPPAPGPVVPSSGPASVVSPSGPASAVPSSGPASVVPSPTITPVVSPSGPAPMVPPPAIAPVVSSSAPWPAVSPPATAPVEPPPTMPTSPAAPIPAPATPFSAASGAPAMPISAAPGAAAPVSPSPGPVSPSSGPVSSAPAAAPVVPPRGPVWPASALAPGAAPAEVPRAEPPRAIRTAAVLLYVAALLMVALAVVGTILGFADGSATVLMLVAVTLFIAVGGLSVQTANGLRRARRGSRPMVYVLTVLSFVAIVLLPMSAPVGWVMIAATVAVSLPKARAWLRRRRSE